MKRWALVAVFVASIPTLADEKDSQEAAARAAYARGRAAAGRNDWRTALEAFDVALVRSGKPALHYDRAVSLERLGRTAEAQEAFEAYLGAAPDAPDCKDVEHHIEELRSQRPVLLPPPAAPRERRKLPRWAWAVAGGGVAVVAAAVVLGVVLGTRSDGYLMPVTLK